MYFLLCLVYYFKQVFSANLDLFYFLTCILMIKAFKENQKPIVSTINIFYFVACYALVQICFIENIDITRLLVNLGKHMLNLFLFFYIKEYFNKFDIHSFLIKISLLFIISIPIAFLFKVNRLWRLNEIVNKYSKERVMLFYTEPSELCFQLSIILIFLVYFILNKQNIKQYLVLSFGIVFLMNMSSGLGGIVITLLVMIVMVIAYFLKNASLRRFLIVYSLFFVICICICIAIYTQSKTYLRILDIMNGSDASINYRLYIGFNVMVETLIDNIMGIGFGNLNTIGFRNNFISMGMTDVIANSFMYFVIESGIFGIVFILGWHLYIVKKISRNNIMLMLPLFLFLILYQVAGGYFTNPINWIIYGVIASGYNKNIKV